MTLNLGLTPQALRLRLLRRLKTGSSVTNVDLHDVAAYRVVIQSLCKQTSRIKHPDQLPLYC